MQTIAIQEAQSHLAEILARLHPGEEIVLTQDGNPVGTLRAASTTPARKPRRLGTLKESVLHMASDFDAIPEGFEEYIG